VNPIRRSSERHLMLWPVGAETVRALVKYDEALQYAPNWAS